MALQKRIELENGVVLNYHRITSLNKITNISNNVEISSYTNEHQREKEKTYQEFQKKSAEGQELTGEEQKELNAGINVFIDTTFIQLPYNEEQTIEEVYEYLKTTDKFKDSINI